MATKQTLTPHHLAKLHVHTGDEVLILTGKDRKQRGKVVRTFPRSNRVLVEGRNMVKRHMKPDQSTRQGGIIEKPMPIHASNVMVICTECGEPTRIGHDRVPQGQDQKLRVRRICKHCGKAIQEQSRIVRS